MSSSDGGLVTLINDSCKAIVVLIINGILNFFHEIIKFSLVLFVVYYLGMWIFMFWDAILEGRIPSVSSALDEIKTSLERFEVQDDIRQVQADLEKFIIEQDLSDMSVDVQPRSSLMERIAKATLNNAEQKKARSENNL